jgi:hypothetical protein
MLLDHLVIAVHDLDIAMADYRTLGFTVLSGGVHRNRATHNALVCFQDGTYLELLAPTGETPLPGIIDFSRILAQGEWLMGYALNLGDLEGTRERLTQGGLAIGEVMPGERQRPDGTVIRWKLALIEDGFAPFLIQDVTPRSFRVPTEGAAVEHANGVTGLRKMIFKMEAPTASARRLSTIALHIEPSPTLPVIAFAEDTSAILFNGEPSRDFPVEYAHGVRLSVVSPNSHVDKGN